MIRSHQWEHPASGRHNLLWVGSQEVVALLKRHVAEVHSNLYFLFTFNRVGILNLIDNVQYYVELEFF